MFSYGLPRTLLSDNGPQFVAKLFQEVCRILGTRNNYASTYHPQTNGHVERMNKTIVSMLRHFVADNQGEWDIYAPLVAHAYNTQVHRSTGATPFELVVTRPPPTLGLDDDHLIPVQDRGAARKKFLCSLEETIRRSREQLLAAQATYKQTFDRRVREKNKSLTIGDYVYLDAKHLEDTSAENRRRRSKLDHLSVGPYRILEVQSHTYTIDIDGVPETISSDRVTRHGPPQSMSLCQLGALLCPELP